MEFARAQTTKKLEGIATSTRTGTLMTFKPGPEIFRETTEFKAHLISQRLRELAFLTYGLQPAVTDDAQAEWPTVDFY